MTLEEYVLTAKDKDGRIIINIADYYERFIKPLDSRFGKSSYFSKSTVLCCWKDHTDINPSLGSIKHKFYKGVRLYHCLGCGATGTVIRMHQRIQKEYYDRNITDTESCLELCKLFGVDATEYTKVQDIGDQSNIMDRFRRVENYKGIYTIRDYQEELMEVRLDSSLSSEERAYKVNIANIKYISTKKQLYS